MNFKKFGFIGCRVRSKLFEHKIQCLMFFFPSSLLAAYTVTVDGCLDCVMWFLHFSSELSC